jgi:hypothetical protein
MTHLFPSPHERSEWRADLKVPPPPLLISLRRYSPSLPPHRSAGGGKKSHLVLATRFLIRVRVLSKPFKQQSPHFRSSSDQSGSGGPGSSRSSTAHFSIAAPGYHFSQPRLKPLLELTSGNKKGSRTPTDASQQPLHLPVRRALQSAHACRRSTAVLARGTFVPKAQRQATASGDSSGAHDPMDRQPGRRPCTSPRVLPAPSCHRPASTSRAGPSAGRVMPKPPGSKGDEPLPAGTATSLPPAAVTRPASFTQSETAPASTRQTTGVNNCLVIGDCLLIPRCFWRRRLATAMARRGRIERIKEAPPRAPLAHCSELPKQAICAARSEPNSCPLFPY